MAVQEERWDKEKEKKMNAIIVVGLARSGKDTVAEFIERDYGLKKFVLSDVLAEELRKRGRKVSKKGMVELGDELRKKHGMDIVARKLYKKIIKSKSKKDVLIVGARSIEEVNYFRKRMKKIFIVKIETPLKERFSRRSSLDPSTLKEFRKRDLIDKKNKGMEKVLSKADYIIKNNSGKMELHKKIGFLIENIYKQKRVVVIGDKLYGYGKHFE
ncbi:MAG: AAA family ATPase [archaeon]